MKILIYGINYSPELTGIGKYSGDMGAWFAQRGHETRVITAPPYYPEWEVQPPFKSWAFKAEEISGARVYRCPLYVPNTPTTVTRLFHLSDTHIIAETSEAGQTGHTLTVLDRPPDEVGPADPPG